jgi:hypothetical protein
LSQPTTSSTDRTIRSAGVGKYLEVEVAFTDQSVEAGDPGCVLIRLLGIQSELHQQGSRTQTEERASHFLAG